jgi:hypothetical protein
MFVIGGFGSVPVYEPLNPILIEAFVGTFPLNGAFGIETT